MVLRSSHLDMDSSEDELYEKAYVETQGGDLNKALWARVLVESEGHREKAQSLYIQHRVKQLKASLEPAKVAESVSPTDPTQTNPEPEFAASTRRSVRKFFIVYHILLLSLIGSVVISMNHHTVNGEALIIIVGFIYFIIRVAYCVAVSDHMKLIGRSGLGWGALAFLGSFIGVWVTFIATLTLKPKTVERKKDRG